MKKPSSGVFSASEIMERVEKQLGSLPGITTSMLCGDLLVVDQLGRNKAQITLTIDLEEDV